MAWFKFETRNLAGGIRGVANVSAVAELCGVPMPVHRTTGKVRAWTLRGARRHLRRALGRRLIEIVSVERAEGRRG